MIEPFFSRRGGMGLGLYLVHEVMTKMFGDGHQGELLFPSRGDVTLPKEFTGAIVALKFPKIS
jgi:signal transduction histidine kinase